MTDFKFNLQQFNIEGMENYFGNNFCVASNSKGNSSNIVGMKNIVIDKHMNIVFNKDIKEIIPVELNAPETILINFMLEKDVQADLKIKINATANSNIVHHIILQEDARLNLEIEQNVKTNNIITVSNYVMLEENARFNYLNTNEAEGGCFNYEHIILDGEVACACIKMLQLPRKQENNCSKNDSSYLATKVLVEHKASNTKADVKTLGINKDNGGIYIDATNTVLKDSYKCESVQSTKIINLHECAKSVASPKLIIENYDVVNAKHSAVIGGVDEHQLYYMCSRGINKSDATQMIVDAKVNNFLS